MKQEKVNIRKMFSRIMKAGLLAVLVVWVSSCSEDRVGQNPIDGTPPAAVTNVQTEAIPGGAKITYDIPKETDISYVVCEYTYKGEKKAVRSSVYTNEVTILGLGEIVPCQFTLYLVDHSENRSKPYTGSFTPLEPPYQTIFKTLEAEADFGGIVARWENETNAMIGAFLLAMEDDGEWTEYDLVFSTLTNEKKSIRGYNTDERMFGVVLLDQYGNTSDTFKIVTNPLYEKALNKKKFSDGALQGDNNTSHNSRPLSNIWNGLTDASSASIWHTVPTAGFTPPQTFTVDLGVEAKLSRMLLWNRTDFSYKQHNPRLFKVWGAKELPEDRKNTAYWNTHTGPWRDGMILLGDFEVIKPSGLPLGQTTAEDTAAEKAGFEFIFESGVGEIRYLRFEVIETFERTAALHIAEISIFGDDGERDE